MIALRRGYRKRIIIALVVRSTAAYSKGISKFGENAIGMTYVKLTC
jgi:hypothetical protein